MKQMKILIVALVVVLLVSVIGINIIQKETDRLYNENEKVTVNEIFGREGENIYYFYKENCSYCIEAKPELVKFIETNKEANTGINFYLVDMDNPNNVQIFYKGDDYAADENFKMDAKDIKGLADLQIVGTPSMIYVEDKQAKDLALDLRSVYSLLNNLNEENGIDVTIGNK